VIKDMTIDITFSSDNEAERDLILDRFMEAAELSGSEVEYTKTHLPNFGYIGIGKVYLSDTYIADFLTSLLDTRVTPESLRGEKDEADKDESWGSLLD